MIRRPPRSTRTDTTLSLHDALPISAVCACILPIHAAFALAGYTQFGLPFSVFLIVATFVVSIVQVVITVRARREFGGRSEEHTSELQSLMRISYAVFCLKKKKK